MQAQPEAEPIFRSDTGPSPVSNVFLSLIVGLILLLPLTYYVVTTRLQPALKTFDMSRTDYNVLSEPEFIGNANYERLAQDERFQESLEYTFVLASYRVLTVLFIPSFIGALAGGQGLLGRTLHRIAFAFIAVLVSPVALAMIWLVFLSPVWGREPSPLLEWMALSGITEQVTPPLASAEAAPVALALLDSLITGAIALVVGGTAFMAVARGRRITRKGAPGLGVWLLMILVAALSAAETFVLPYLTTRGGPANATLTVGLELFQQGFQRFNFGYASAQAMLIITASLIIAFLIWLVVIGFNLRLSYTREVSPTPGAGCLFVISIPLLGLLMIPLVGLVYWGHWLVTNNGGYAPITELTDWQEGLGRTLTVPLQTIWFIQVPITLLAGLSLGFVRPFGRSISNLLFLPLLLLAFLPTESLIFGWYIQIRDAGMVNTFEALNLPWLVSGLALVVFKMFFDGTYEKYNAARRTGRVQGEALLQIVILPSLLLALVVGAVLSFAAAHSLTWPLIVITDRELFPLPLELMFLNAQFATQNVQMVGAAIYYIGLIGVIALPAFVLLQMVALDRLALLGGKSDDTIFSDKKSKVKPRDKQMLAVDEGDPIVYTR